MAPTASAAAPTAPSAPGPAGRPPLRIYATSGDASQAMLQALEKSGFDGTLPKPVFPSAYRQTLEPAAAAAGAPSGAAGAAGAAKSEAQLARQAQSPPSSLELSPELARARPPPPPRPSLSR